MKIIASIIFYVVCILQSGKAQVSSSVETEVELVKKFVQVSKYHELHNYFPRIKYFLTTGYAKLENGPGAILSYLHEGYHVFNSIKSPGMGGSLYFWNDVNPLLKVNLLNNYVTSDNIFNLLPDIVKDKPLTKTYISCTNDCFSKAKGIYGLLEEFSAYGLEARSLVDMYNYFDTCDYTDKKEFWEGYLKSKYDCWMNFYYFNIFMSTYMKYINVNHGLFYNQLNSDIKFREVFNMIYRRFGKSLEELDCLEGVIKKRLLKYGGGVYLYPFYEEYDSIMEVSKSESVRMYLKPFIY